MPHALNTSAARGITTLRDAELAGESDGVHAAATAEGHEREVPRVVTAVDGTRA